MVDVVVEVTTTPILGSLYGPPAGGTTGQFLIKKSATFGDVGWADPPTGGGTGTISINGVSGSTFVIGKSNVGLANVPNVDTTNAANITSGVLPLGRIPTGTDMNSVALGNHVHDSSTITGLSTALASKAPTASPTFTGTVSGVTKSMVGLDLVDNVSDANKIVSGPQQAALNLRAPLDSPAFTGAVTGITKTMVGLSLADNVADANKPVSGPQQAALDLKATLASPTFTGTVVVPTPTTTTGAANKSYVDGLITPSATTSVQGKLLLAGDLAGTATAPIVARINGTTIGAAPAVAGMIVRSTGAAAASWFYPSLDWYNAANYGTIDGTNSTTLAAAQANTTAINAAITACPEGGTVYIPAGIYRLTAPLVAKSNITIRGGHGTRYMTYGGNSAHLKPYSGSFAGTELISGTDINGLRLEKINLYGISQTTLSTTGGLIHGIGAYGKCKGWRLTEVMATFFSGDGVHTDSTTNGWAGGWEVQNLFCTYNRYGWGSQNSAANTFGFSDSKIINSECSTNRSDGWHWEGGTAANTYDTLFAAFNSGNGYYQDGPISNVLYSACQTDRSTKNGWYSSCSESATAGAPTPHAVVFSGCIASRDGNNDGAQQGTYAGFYFDGASTASPHVMVTMNGCHTHVAKGDTGNGIYAPDYGVYANNCRPNGVLINGSIFTATVSTLFDNNNAIIEGPTNSHTLIALSDGTVNYNYRQPTIAPSVATALGGKEPTLPTGGTSSTFLRGDKTWATPPTAAATVPSGVITPEFFNLLQWNVPPFVCNNTFQYAADGTVYTYKLYTAKSITVANAVMNISTAGATLTTGQNLVGLYNSAKTLVGTSADQSTAWTTIGTKVMPLTVVSGQSLVIPAGFFYVGVVARGTTRPAFLRTVANNSLSNGLLANADSFWATADTGVTTAMPTTLGAMTSTNNPVWCGVS